MNDIIIKLERILMQQLDLKAAAKLAMISLVPSHDFSIKKKKKIINIISPIIIQQILMVNIYHIGISPRGIAPTKV